MTDFTRRSNNAREMERVAIVAVDPASRTATGVTRIRTSIQINCAFATGDTVTTPAVGEQWYVERLDMEWRLYGRIPFNDATLNIEPEEGQVLVGSASGPLELNGTEIRANGRVLRLNGVYYRDDGETLQRSMDGVVWEAISAQAAGMLQLVGYALAGIPGSAAVAEFLDKLSPDDTAALQGLIEWASHLGDGLGDVWNVFCDNPFVTALRDLGTGDSPLAQIASGLQDFLNSAFQVLFCDFTGNLTPQTALAGLQGVADLFTNNPFVQGLSNLVGDLGLGTGNLLSDAVTGIGKFLEQLFGLFFCDFSGDFTPQAALDAISNLLTPLADNVFIQGLATLADTLGTGVGNLFADAISGATGLIDGLFRAVFCDFTGDVTPQNIISHIGDLLEPLRTNPFIVGLGDLATTFGTGIGNLAHDAVVGATNLLQAVFGAIFCDFTGTFTPQAMLTKLTEVLGGITANPFVAGLISFAEGLGHTVGGGIEKAFAGINELLEALFGIFFCDNTGVPTPQVLVDSIGGVVDFIRTNPLIEGLIEFIENAGTTSTGFLQKALEGGFAFFNEIINTLFCNLPGTPTPTEIMASLAAIISSVTSNPYVVMLRALATNLGNTSTNLIQQLMAGITGIFDWFVDLLNTLIPFFDWNQIKTLNFPAMMADLLDGLNPLAFLGPDGLLPIAKLPTIAFDMLSGAATFLQDNIFGPLEDAILGGLNGTLTGGLAALNQFFDGALATGGSLLQQIANAMTGVGTFSTGPLAAIRNLFSGITLGGGNLITQITNTLGEIVSSLDIAAMVSNITGIDINDLPTDPLDALSQFFSGFSTFTGTNTLLSQVLAQAGTNLKPLVSAITGIAEAAITDVVTTASNYFGNFRSLFNFDLGAGFNLPAARNALIGVLNNATAGLLSGTLINNIGIGQVTDLVRFVTGKVAGIPGDIETMFTNLRNMFTSGSVFTLLPGGAFNLANAANSFITNVLSRATAALTSFIPAHALANLPISKLPDLVNALTGQVGATVTQFTNFFTNLRKFLNIGSGGGLVDFLVDPGSFSLVGALNSFITNVLNLASSTISSTLIPVLDITKINNLIGFLTGKTVGVSAADVDTFFANLRKMLNIGSGVGQINLTVTQTISDLQNALFGVVSQVNAGINSFITQTGLSSWLGAANFAEIGNFFTNLVQFFKIGDFKIAPGSFNIATVAGNFIRDVLNVATGTLLNPLKVLGIGGSGTLIDDLGARPLLTSLTSWLTSTGTANDIQKFFTNLRSTLGLGAVDFLGTFNLASAQTAIYNVITGINTTVGNLATSAALALKTGISEIVAAITGTGSSDLNPIAALFSGVSALTGSTLSSKWVNQITGLITGGTAALGEFFAGLLNNATVTANSLIHKVVSAITGSAGVQTLANLGTFFGSFTSSATTLVGKVVDHITGLITSGLAGMSLTNFFSGFNGVGTPATDSLAYKLAQTLGGASATTLGALGNFFANLRTFLGGGNLASFFGSTASFSLTSVAENFISSVLRAPGVVTKLVTLGVNNLLDLGIIPDLGISKITNLVQYLTGTGTQPADVQTFFTNLRSLFGSVSFLPSGAFDFVGAANAFITNVLSKATTTLAAIPAAVIQNFSIDKITNLIPYLTGKANGVIGDVQTVFDNLRAKVLSGIDLTNPALTLANARDGLLALVAAANSAVDTFITQTKMTGWFGGTLAEIGNFFTNLTQFFKLGDFKVSPASFLTNLPAVAGNFIRDILNVATGTLLNPLKVLGIGGSGTLTDDLNARPLLNTLIGWVNTSGAANDIQKFFTNIRNLLSGIDFFSGTFNAGTAQQTLLNLLATANNTVQAFATKAANDLKAGIADVVQAITGVTGATNLNAITSFFSGLIPATVAGAGSLVYQVVNAITGANGPLPNLSTFFGGFTSSASTLVGRVVDHITALITGGAGTLSTFFTNLRNFFGTTLTGNLFSGTFDPVGALSTFISRLVSQTGLLPLLNNGKLDLATIPKLGVDILEDIGDWIDSSVVQPVISTLITNSKIDLSKLGIDLTKLSPKDFNLTALGVWANNLLTNVTKIPAENIVGQISSALLGLIPVSHITQVSPNLLALGAFSAASTLDAADGWTWDETQNYTGQGGSAKVTINPAKNRQLFSRQVVPVAPGDQLRLSAWVKTSGLTATGNPITLGLVAYNGTTPINGSVPLSTFTLASTAANASWTKISNSTVYTVPANATSVLVVLGVTSSASAGQVWFDDVSLNKEGLLKQSLVDRLIEGWNNLWDGLLGNPVGTTIGRTVDHLFTAANFLWQSGQNTLTTLTNLASGLLNNAASFIGNIGNVLMDGVKSIGQFLTGLWNGLTGNAGNSAAKTVDQVTAATASVQITANNASIAAGLAQTAADAAQTAADGAQTAADDVKFDLNLKARDFSNLSAGSDFEGTTQPWWWDTGVTGFSLDTAQKHSGARSLRLTAGTGGRAAYLGPYPTVFEVRPGEQFYVEFWTRRNSTYSATATAEFRVADQANTRIGGINLLSTDFTQVDTWVKVSDIFTVPAGTTGMIFSIQFGTTSGNIWLDELVIRKVVQPETIAPIPPDKVEGLPVGVLVNQQLVDHSATIQELQSTQQAASNQGKVISVSAAQYPAGGLPSDWQVTYSPTTGANTVGVAGGSINWSATPEVVTRSAKLVYVGQTGVDGDEKTDSDFQSIRFTMPTLPEGAGDDVTRGPQFWALGRVSDDSQTYVWARAFWTNAGVFRGEMGCTINGVEQTPWVTNIVLTPSTTLTLNCGVGSSARVFELWSGNFMAASYEEVGTTSRLCSAGHTQPADHTSACVKHRRFGAITEVKRMYDNGGSTSTSTNRVSRVSRRVTGGYYLGDGGSFSAVSVSDSVVPAFNGSVARMSRISTATVNFPTADTALPSNFFDSPDYETLDIDSDAAAGTFTVKKSRAYLVTARVRLSTWFTALCTVNLQVWNGSTWTTVQKGNSVWPYDSFHTTQADRHALSGTWIQYLNAGEKIRLSTERNNGSGSVLRGTPGGSETYFSISALQ